MRKRGELEMQEKTGGRWTLSEPSLLSKILPKYMILPLVILIVGDLLAYYGPRYINLFLGRPHLDMSCLFDAKITLIPGFVFIYVLAFPFWYLITYFYLRLGREQALRFSISNISAKMLCAALFILIPSALVRPELAGETPSVAAAAIRFQSLTGLFARIRADGAVTSSTRTSSGIHSCRRVKTAQAVR